MDVEKLITDQEDFEYGRILPSHISFQDRVLISKLIKKSYREGFLNGMAIRQDGDTTPIQEKQ